MRIIEREKQSSVNFEDLMEAFQAREEVDTHGQRKGKKTFLSSFFCANVILSTMTVALGILVILLKTDIVILKNDMTELKNLKAHIATLDPKIQISTVEARFEDVKKEKEAIKREMDQLKADLETFKIESKNEKTMMQKKRRNRTRSPEKFVAHANKDELVLKKISTKKIFFSDISRAMNPELPEK